MSKSIQSIRGMHDVLPDDSHNWQALEATIRQAMSSYGYREIRMPLVESTDLFCRSIGEVTDIVEKEMYTFEDRNGDMLTLRPEGTASCVRAGIQHGLLHNQIQRLWYMGPMFRHERPQKGRYRQFHQFGVEAFGISEPDIDAELIFLSARLWRELNLENDVHLELNTLGSTESRARYRDVLVEYLGKNKSVLDDDSLRRLDTNPLRVLDSKNPEMSELISMAPDMFDYLDEESEAHFNKLKSYLDEAGIKYIINPRLVRGLDYYCKTVFEWITDKLGAQGTVCAGGRYDGLVKQLGGRQTPAAGFALGVERLLALIEQSGTQQSSADIDVYFILQGESSDVAGMKLAEHLRDQLPELKILTNCGGGSLKSQIKRADKSGARIALILGEDEMQKNAVSIKYLREDREQQMVDKSEIASEVERIFKNTFK